MRGFAKEFSSIYVQNDVTMLSKKLTENSGLRYQKGMGWKLCFLIFWVAYPWKKCFFWVTVKSRCCTVII
jgi:hypothetical protein